MTLNFPNPSRSYEEAEYGVRFWAYDETIEVSFLIEEAALTKINSETKADKVGFLNTFDVNSEQIHEVAANVYFRKRNALRIFSFTLTDLDF